MCSSDLLRPRRSPTSRPAEPSATSRRASWRPREGRRCGDRSRSARLRPGTRLQPTVRPLRRSRAHTLRWPSPTKGEGVRSERIASSRRSSEIDGTGPRLRAGACRCTGKSHNSPARPPPGKRALPLHALPRQFVLHGEHLRCALWPPRVRTRPARRRAPAAPRPSRPALARANAPGGRPRRRARARPDRAAHHGVTASPPHACARRSTAGPVPVRSCSSPVRHFAEIGRAHV